MDTRARSRRGSEPCCALDRPCDRRPTAPPRNLQEDLCPQGLPPRFQTFGAGIARTPRNGHVAPSSGCACSLWSEQSVSLGRARSSRRTTSAFVCQTKGLATSKERPSTVVAKAVICDSASGCVERVARLPTTCGAIGRLKLMMPFSKKRIRAHPIISATTLPMAKKRKVRVRCVYSASCSWFVIVTSTGTCRHSTTEAHGQGSCEIPSGG